MGQTPKLHEQLLETVRIGTPHDALGVPLADPALGQSMAQQAMWWSYVLRSRQRWLRDAKVREQHQEGARKTLELLGLTPDMIQQLGGEKTLVVRVPYQHEGVCWEGRIFPWEYVLAAATREWRRGAANGPLPLTVIRELQVQHEVEGRWEPQPRDAVVFPENIEDFRVLVVNALPAELSHRWSIESELKALTDALPDGVVAPRVLNYPSLEELVAELHTRPPHLLHVAGVDSHQGLRELSSLFGQMALVDAPDEDKPDAYKVQLVDELVADSRRLLDGLLLRGPSGYPRLVPAQALAQAVAGAVRSKPPYLTTLNVWNSAARLAPMLIAEGASRAAVGFQDAFDDSLAEHAITQLLRHLFANSFDLPAAFSAVWQEVRALPESVDATGVTLWLGGPMFVDEETAQDHADRGLALAKSRSHEAAPAPPEVASAGVRCDIVPEPELNYVVLHNAQPLFRRFELYSEAFKDEAPLDVEVAVHLGDEQARFHRRVVMAHARETLKDVIHVPLTAELARGVHEAINTSLQVRVSQGAKVLYHDSHRLRLLPADQWPDNRRDGPWLPSFVLPRDPAVVHAVQQAQRYNRVLRDDPTAGFEGYQCVPGDAWRDGAAIDEAQLSGVDRQVEALWATLLHDWQLGYINPPPSYSNALDSQRLRMPSAVLAGRAGTCIDLALLFAACLELVDIYPVVFLLEGHALPGWWRHPSYREDYMQMKGNYSSVVQADENSSSAANAQTVPWQAGPASWDEVRQLIAQRRLVPIETVRLTEHCGFIEAVEAGVEALSVRGDYDSMLDIITARQRQITPLPLLREAAP